MSQRQKDGHDLFFQACPECDTPFPEGEKYQLGEIVECVSCGAESEIISINPLKLVLLEEEK